MTKNKKQKKAQVRYVRKDVAIEIKTGKCKHCGAILPRFSDGRLKSCPACFPFQHLSPR